NHEYAKDTKGLALPSSEAPGDGADRVEVDVRGALLQRDDGVVGDPDVLGAHLGAALGDVAHAHAGFMAKQLAAVQRVLGLHLQAGHPHHEAGAVEGVLPTVVAQDVTDVLAQEALDALAELDDS